MPGRLTRALEAANTRRPCPYTPSAPKQRCRRRVTQSAGRSAVPRFSSSPPRGVGAGGASNAFPRVQKQLTPTHVSRSESADCDYFWRIRSMTGAVVRVEVTSHRPEWFPRHPEAALLGGRLPIVGTVVPPRGRR